MTVDEILADPIGALGLPDGAIPVSVVLLVEYAHPGSDNYPQRRRLAFTSDDNLPVWTSIGMMHYGVGCEMAAPQEKDTDE